MQGTYSTHVSLWIFWHTRQNLTPQEDSAVWKPPEASPTPGSSAAAGLSDSSVKAHFWGSAPLITHWRHTARPQHSLRGDTLNSAELLKKAEAWEVKQRLLCLYMDINRLPSRLIICPICRTKKAENFKIIQRQRNWFCKIQDPPPSQAFRFKPSSLTIKTSNTANQNCTRK